MMAARLIKRLHRGSRAFRDQNIVYDAVGHWLPVAYVPTRGLRRDLKLVVGGTPEGTAKEQADSWSRILHFLTEASRGGKQQAGHIREAP
jgi:hypothetical protein